MELSFGERSEDAVSTGSHYRPHRIRPRAAVHPVHGKARGAFSLKGCLQGLHIHLKTSVPGRRKKHRFKSIGHSENKPVNHFKEGPYFLSFDNDLNRCTQKRRHCCPCSCLLPFDALHRNLKLWFTGNTIDVFIPVYWKALVCLYSGVYVSLVLCTVFENVLE